MYQEVGLGVGALKREDIGPWRYLGARKSVPLGVGVPGSLEAKADASMSIHIRQEDQVVGDSCFDVDPAQPEPPVRATTGDVPYIMLCIY